MKIKMFLKLIRRSIKFIKFNKNVFFFLQKFYIKIILEIKRIIIFL